MPTSFGNADTITANQQSMLTLSERDTATSQKEGETENDIIHIGKPKWRVKWKSQTMSQTNAAEFISGTTLSNSSSILPQVPARSLTGGQENTSCMMHTQVPLRHAFVQGNVVSTNNTGPVVTNVVQIGNPIIQGNVDSTNNMGPFATNVVQTGPYGGSNSFNTNTLVVCSASSYTKRRSVKWKLRLTNCDARDTGQKRANTTDLRETQLARGMDTIYTQSPTALHGNLNGVSHDSFNVNSIQASMTPSLTDSMAISRPSSLAVTMRTSTTVCMTVPMTISMANDNYEDRNMDIDRDKDKFRDNDNGRDNNNASLFNDKCNVITNDNDTGNNEAHTYSTIRQYSALPAAWRNEPIGLAELTGDMEYKIEGDRGEGSGGPSHSPP